MVGLEIWRNIRAYLLMLYPRDNPEWDATDWAHLAWWRGNEVGVKQVTLALWAHPAWWRGNEVGVKQVTLALTLALDGMDDGSGVYGYAELEALRRRILQLRKDTNEPRVVPPEAKYGAGDLDGEPGPGDGD
jgi:hypothetical protein